MNWFFTPMIASLLWLSCGSAHSQTLNWGSQVFDDLVDSNGESLNDTFVFEIGSFTNDFVPDESNVSQWHANWRVFDRAINYNEYSGPEDDIWGYYTSSARMRDDGTSTGNQATSGFSFSGLEGYLWVRNSNDPSPTTEWFLARSDQWTFQTATPGCCDNELPDSWSLSDLSNENVTPVFGSQGTFTGGGYSQLPGNHTMQTFTFVPEPSSALLSATGLAFLILRRRRSNGSPSK